MKLYVDDIRKVPGDDWIIARNVNDAIRVLAQMEFDEISLDHDISHQLAMETGVSRPYPCSECFCAVAFYIGEKYKFSEDIGSYPKITLHTSNPVGAEKMKNILKDYNLECEIKLSGFTNRLEQEV